MAAGHLRPPASSPANLPKETASKAPLSVGEIIEEHRDKAAKIIRGRSSS
jgi:hypothetical protein